MTSLLVFPNIQAAVSCSSDVARLAGAGFGFTVAWVVVGWWLGGGYAYLSKADATITSRKHILLWGLFNHSFYVGPP